MRLWHKDLIPVLPKKQLIAQWRECCAIASNIAKKGTPNHILVNKIMDYSHRHFLTYTILVTTEMAKRGYKVSSSSVEKLYHNILDNTPLFGKIPHRLSQDLYEDWHNERYLIQCLINLQEKFDCGMFDDDPEDVKPLLNFIKKTIYY